MFRTYRTASSSSVNRELLFMGAFSMGLVLSACGGKEKPIGGGDGGSSSAAPTEAGDASAMTTSAGTTGVSNVSSSGAVNSGTSNQRSDAGQETEVRSDAGSTESQCGGAGQTCCARAVCDDGFVCINEPTNTVDAGLVVFDAGPNNQAFVDGGFDASFGGTTPGSDAAVNVDAGSEPEAPAGVCAPCGGEGERCCAEGACDGGLSCEASGSGPNVSRLCIDDGCGAEGQQCCAGSGAGDNGQCDDGLTCDNPPGDMLDNSECLMASTEDAGESEDGGPSPLETDAASEECGGLDQPCCPSRGGRCNDGLECDRRPPSGIEGNICIEG